MAQPEIASDRARLRARWYAESFYSARTCLDAFVDAATVHAQVPIVFASHQNETCHTVGRIHAAAISVAAGLQRLGVRAGDSVAVQLTNRLECAIAYQAVLLTGAVLVPIVHIYGMAEVEFIVSQSRAKALIMPARLRSTSYVDRIPRLSQLPDLDHIVVVDAIQPDHGGLDWSQIAADRRDYVAPPRSGPITYVCCSIPRAPCHPPKVFSTATIRCSPSRPLCPACSETDPTMSIWSVSRPAMWEE